MVIQIYVIRFPYSSLNIPGFNVTSSIPYPIHVHYWFISIKYKTTARKTAVLYYSMHSTINRYLLILDHYIISDTSKYEMPVFT